MFSGQHGLILVAVAGLLVVSALLAGAFMVRRKKMLARSEQFRARWQQIQRDCGKSDKWPMCLIEADKLLDEALKAAGFKGRTMGERLVAAQRTLTDNDGAWFGHKLRNKVVNEEINRLYKRDVQTALMGLRQALQDLGAL